MIGERFGERYGTGKGRVYKTKAEGRPGGARVDPADVVPARPGLAARRTSRPTSYKLYRLIWQRAIASQMAPKELETTTVELAAGDYRLRASATRTLFDGFARVYTEGQDDAAEEAERTLPPLREGDVTAVASTSRPTQHFTEPPPRYTEATLIKALEEHGIGRPSTYAATISTIVDRGYVRVEERRLHPEEIGEIVTDFLVDVLRRVRGPRRSRPAWRSELDEVAARRARVGAAAARLLRPAQGPRRREPQGASSAATSRPGAHRRGLLARATRWSSGSGGNGKFLACSTYPEHKETRPLPGEEAPKLEGDGDPCPQCGEGTLTTKRGRFGAFVGCSRYPDCTYIRKDGPPPPDQLPFEVACPKNGDGRLVARRARRTGNVFWGCSAYPKCDFTTNDEPTGAVHDAADAAHADGGVAWRARARPASA